MLSQELEYHGHIGGDVAVHAKQVCYREMAPFPAIPPCEQKIGSARRLSGVRAGEIKEPVEGSLYLGMGENFHVTGRSPRRCISCTTESEYLRERVVQYVEISGDAT